MTGAEPAAVGEDRPVELHAADGWRLAAVLRLPPDGASAAPGAVLVHGSKHERDAYGMVLLDQLAARGVASLRFDIRGRGASRDGRSYHRMAPLQRRGVVHDVAAAVDRLAGDPAVDGTRLAVVGEQDTAAACVAAAVAAREVQALALVSPRLHPSRIDSLAGRGLPFLGLVSKEDRASLRATVDAYLTSPEPGSELHVLDGLGFGTTMFSARAFEEPDATRLEVLIAAWVAARLDVGDAGRAPYNR